MPDRKNYHTSLAEIRFVHHQPDSGGTVREPKSLPSTQRSEKEREGSEAETETSAERLLAVREHVMISCFSVSPREKHLWKRTIKRRKL